MDDEQENELRQQLTYVLYRVATLLETKLNNDTSVSITLSNCNDLIRHEVDINILKNQVKHLEEQLKEKNDGSDGDEEDDPFAEPPPKRVRRKTSR